MANPDDSGHHGGRRKIQSAFRLLLLISSPIVIALLLAAVQLEDFYPAAYPAGPDAPASAASVDEHWSELGAPERVGDGFLPGPEDLAYDEAEGFLYTGCHDGWIRRLRPAEAARDVAVEEWANVGGRPLGVALSPDGGVVVAEAYKGRSLLWDFILKYPFIRKLLAVASKLTNLPEAKDGGVLSVNLEGKPLALYRDREVSSVSGGLKVGNHLYIGSLNKRYILRIDLTKFASNAL